MEKKTANTLVCRSRRQQWERLPTIAFTRTQAWRWQKNIAARKSFTTDEAVRMHRDWTYDIFPVEYSINRKQAGWAMQPFQRHTFPQLSTTEHGLTSHGGGLNIHARQCWHLTRQYIYPSIRPPPPEPPTLSFRRFASVFSYRRCQTFDSRR